MRYDTNEGHYYRMGPTNGGLWDQNQKWVGKLVTKTIISWAMIRCKIELLGLPSPINRDEGYQNNPLWMGPLSITHYIRAPEFHIGIPSQTIGVGFFGGGGV